MQFKPGHEKVGGCPKGAVNKRTRFRQEAVCEAMKRLALTPDENLLAMTPLEAMCLCMRAALEVGDQAGALEAAAAAAAPYVHPKLNSVDMQFTSKAELMTDAELEAEIKKTLPN
jgi:hypothetical protein